MSLLSRGLYPNDLVMGAWNDVASYTACSSVSDEAWRAVLANMGAEGVEIPVLIAAVPLHLLIESIAAWRAAAAP